MCSPFMFVLLCLERHVRPCCVVWQKRFQILSSFFFLIFMVCGCLDRRITRFIWYTCGSVCGTWWLTKTSLFIFLFSSSGWCYVIMFFFVLDISVFIFFSHWLLSVDCTLDLSLKYFSYSMWLQFFVFFSSVLRVCRTSFYFHILSQGMHNGNP